MADGADSAVNWTERLLTIIERQGAHAAEIAGLHRSDAEQRNEIKDVIAKIDTMQATITTQFAALRADVLTQIDRALAAQAEPASVSDGVRLSPRDLLLIIIAVALAAVILTYVAVTQMGVRHVPGVTG